MTKSRVSAPQFFSVLYLSMLSSIFMYISSRDISISQTDSLLRPIVFIFISIIFAIPTFLVFKTVKEKTETGLIVDDKRIFFKIIATVYALVYFVAILRALARFDLFASSELFPGTDMTVFIVALVIICGLLSLLGLGSLSRAAVIFTLIVVGATGFVMVSLWKDVDLLNFTPLMEKGVGSFIYDSLYFALQGAEIGIIMLFLPHIKGTIAKTYILWSVLSGVTFIFILFFTIGTLGAFADTQLFPTYTAVTLAEFGLLERMDALETAIWVLCIVEKVSLYFLGVISCIKFILPKIPVKLICGVCIFTVSILLSFISADLERFNFMSYVPLVIGLFVVPVLILPIALIIYFKKVKPYDENIPNN